MSVGVSQCPTCYGRGIVPRGFFRVPAGQVFTDSQTGPDPCRTCNGSGLVDFVRRGDTLILRSCETGER